MRILRRLGALALFVGALVVGWLFAAGNPEPVRVNYLLGVIEGRPAWSVMVGSFGLGALLSALAALLPISRAKLVARRHRKAAARLESEIHQLRNLPLATDDEAPPRGSAGGSPELREVAAATGRGD
ncbi:MAG: lipopolysaccharide assembly protein LapA domain-containing protein [Myxococcota bacterium]|nr:lipopolysaccharide assembly protein LapA domain-containing protein [Myxococcota bacterium]